MFGHALAGVVPTRLERPIAGARIPERFGTFDRLCSVANSDPFEGLIYIGVGKPEPTANDYDRSQYLMEANSCLCLSLVPAAKTCGGKIWIGYVRGLQGC